MQYGKAVWGLRDFSLRLGPGIVGLLGPNGAGKSTVMRIIATITQPTSGAIHWNGGDTVQRPDNLRRVLGYLPQDFGVYPNLNVVEFLTYLAAVKGLDRSQARQRIEELIQLVNLSEAAYRPIDGFSGGMRQRVGIAQALLGFYLVRGSVQLDRQTGVGQILAATPLRRVAYVLGKFVSNTAVLMVIVGVLAMAALAMLLIHGEDRTLDLYQLLLPGFLAGALFIPSLALLLGVVGGSERPLQILLLIFWYLGPLNGLALFDFTGATPDAVAQGIPWYYLALSLPLLGLALLARWRQMAA